MRQFFKFITASCLGTLLAIAVIIMITMAGIGIAAGTSSAKNKITKEGVLHLKIDFPVIELTENMEQEFATFDKTKAIGLNDIAALIDHAKTDDKIEGILIQTEKTICSASQALQIAQMIKDFKTSGKFVHAYGNYFTQSGYIIAHMADSIALNPVGMVDLRGFGTAIPYLKDFSEKTDIDFDVYHAGKFKSAIEPYYRSESSKENRLQTQEYLGDILDVIVESIHEARGIPKDQVRNIFDQALTSEMGDQALALNIVDELAYWGDYEDRLADKIGEDELELISLVDYYRATDIKSVDASDRIAIVYAEGEIMPSDKKGQISMSRYGEILDKVKDNDKIKAMVLRVNSPGGSAFESEQFWKKVEDIKKAGKKVVASYGTYAASGGYYISCGSDVIVSEPTTLTGSIGVFFMIPQMHEFFDNKLGIDFDTIATGDYNFMYSSVVERGENDDERIKKYTEYIYDLFKKRVAEGRNMTVEEVHEIAQGRVWSGVDAQEVGLVDEIGDINKALEIAAQEAGLEEYKVLEYPNIKKSFFEEMIEQVMAAEKEVGIIERNVSIQSKLGKELDNYIHYMENSCKGPQARLPYMIQY